MSRRRLVLAAAVAGVGLSIGVARAAPVQFTGTFEAVNNSGVSGTTSLSLDGTTLTVSVIAAGLEASQVHAQHIHGFADPTQVSICPPATFPPDASIDTNANGLIDDTEAETLSGPPLLGLTGTNGTTNSHSSGSGEPGGVGLPTETGPVYPTAAADGSMNYTGVFTIDPAVFGNFADRVVELHGMTVSGAYDDTLPVACAELAMTSSGGGGNGGGGNAIPLPPAVWGGSFMLVAMSMVSFAKRARAA